VSDQVKPPTGPDWYPIAQIHRAHDGLITFLQKGEGEEFHSFAIRAEDLQQYFPEFVEELEQDAYFSLHGMYRPEKAGRGILRGSYRKTRNLRWLNAAWVDCDCYNVGATWAAAVGMVAQAFDLVPTIAGVLKFAVENGGIHDLGLVSSPAIK